MDNYVSILPQIGNSKQSGSGGDNVQHSTPGGGEKRGIYEFPDQTAGEIPYVGQSKNLPQCLRAHERAGRLKRGTETTRPVDGGKTAREIAEHQRIQKLTGGAPAKQSSDVANKVDPIGPNRRHLLNPRTRAAPPRPSLIFYPERSCACAVRSGGARPSPQGLKYHPRPQRGGLFRAAVL